MFCSAELFGPVSRGLRKQFISQEPAPRPLLPADISYTDTGVLERDPPGRRFFGEPVAEESV